MFVLTVNYKITTRHGMLSGLKASRSADWRRWGALCSLLGFANSLILFSYLGFQTLASMWAQYMTAQSCVHEPITSIVYSMRRIVQVQWIGIRPRMV